MAEKAKITIRGTTKQKQKQYFPIAKAKKKKKKEERKEVPEAKKGGVWRVDTRFREQWSARKGLKNRGSLFSEEPIVKDFDFQSLIWYSSSSPPTPLCLEF